MAWTWAHAYDPGYTDREQAELLHRIGDRMGCLDDWWVEQAAERLEGELRWYNM